MKCVIETNIKKYVDLCYREDQTFITKFHITSGNSADKCINDSVNIISKTDGEFIVVYKDSDVLGYFGKATLNNTNLLTTLFVRVKYRKPEYLKEYWCLIRKEFDNKFFITGLYEKNTKAVNFCLKNGGKIINSFIDRNNNAFVIGFN